MITYEFDYYRPDTIQEAVDLSKHLKTSGQKAIYYGGGTEFITMARLNNIYVDAIIDIKNIPECNVYEIDGDELIVGSAITLTHIAEMRLFPLLSMAAHRVADHTVRGKITLGGNLAGSIIYKETSLPLLVANSDILIGKIAQIKRIPFNEYWSKSPEEKKGDLIIQLIIDKRYLALPHAHVKRTKNEKIGYPLVSIAALKDGENINIAFSGICDVPFRSKDIEKALNDSTVSKDERIHNMLENIPFEILDDLGGAMEYRKFMLSKVVEDMVEAFEGGDGHAQNIWH